MVVPPFAPPPLDTLHVAQLLNVPRYCHFFFFCVLASLYSTCGGGGDLHFTCVGVVFFFPRSGVLFLLLNSWVITNSQPLHTQGRTHCSTWPVTTGDQQTQTGLSHARGGMETDCKGNHLWKGRIEISCTLPPLEAGIAFRRGDNTDRELEESTTEGKWAGLL